MASVQLVETYEEDSHVAVTQYVAGLLPEAERAQFLPQCEALIAGGRVEELVDRLTAKLPAVYAAAPAAGDKDVEAVLAVLAHLVPRAADPPALAARVAAALATAGSAPAAAVAAPHPDARLAALMALYAAVPTGEAKAAVLGRACALAGAAGAALATPLARSLRGRGDALRRELALGDGPARALFLSLAALNRAVPDDAPTRDERRRLLTLALSLPSASAAGDAPQQLRAAARELCRLFLSDAAAIECDFWPLPAVQALASAAPAAAAPSPSPDGSPPPSSDAALLRLLGATLAGDLAQYRAAATPEAVAAVVGGSGGPAAAAAPAPVPPAALAAAALLLEDKARLSALLALASSAAPNGRVPFASVRAALDLPDDADVQRWVARAISKGALDARIDAVDKEVSVARAARPRAFGPEEWARLSERLALWEARLGGAAGMVAACTGDGGTRGGGAHIQLPAAVV